MKNAGIDYSNRTANIDEKTGCRYGVISINSLHDHIWDYLMGMYSAPTCPECGSTVEDSEYGKDYFCRECFEKNHPNMSIEELNNSDVRSIKCVYYADHCYGDPVGYILDHNDYIATTSFDDTCIFLTDSPYYTFTEFCSPCAPGAGNLDSPIEDGVKTLCFGHDMFEDGVAPYPVYRVSDDSLVEPTKE